MTVKILHRIFQVNQISRDVRKDARPCVSMHFNTDVLICARCCVSGYFRLIRLPGCSQRRTAVRLYKRGSCVYTCLLYTSDAADEEDSVDLGGRRIIKKKKKKRKERNTVL